MVLEICFRSRNNAELQIKSHQIFYSNKIDDLIIVEVKIGIKEGYTCIIPNKELDILIFIIEKYVNSGSVKWTNEHKSIVKLKYTLNILLFAINMNLSTLWMV